MKRVVMLAAVAVAVLTGCEDGVQEYPTDELAAAVTVSFQQQVGELPKDRAVCDGPLGDKAGSVQTCTVTWRGDRYTITARRADDGEASFVMSPKPPPFLAPALEQNVANDYASQPGAKQLTRVHCPEHMQGKPGESQVCVLTLKNGQTIDATVTVKGTGQADANGNEITNFHVVYAKPTKP